MTEPPAPMPSPDPITAILVSLTEMRGEVRSALSDLKRHDTDITQLRHGHNELRDRVTVLETQHVADGQHEQHRYSGRAVFWTAAGVCIAAVALLVTIFINVHGG